MTRKLSVFAIISCCLVFMQAGPVLAQGTPSIESLQEQIKALQEQSQRQIKALQDQVDALKAAQEKQAEEAAQAQAARAAAPAPVAEAASEAGAGKTMFTNTAVKVTLGGYLAMTGIYRDRYTGSDNNSKWNINGASGSGGIPLPNSPNYYMDEVRGSARATRLSLLAEGKEDYAALSGYTEVDFLGGAGTSSANSQSTNGYFPRIRQLWGAYDTAGGWHLLAGQAFTLLTLNSQGIIPRKELLPIVVDNTYVPGFTYARQPQVRLVKDFGDGVWLGMALENPQVVIAQGGLASGTQGAPTLPTSAASYTGALLGTGNAFYDVSTTNNSNLPSSLSLDQFPDITAKVALDPGFGHYEGYGIARFFTDRTLIAGNRSNETTEGWGLGVGVSLPLVPKYLDFETSFLGGEGIGRYGAAGLFDAVVNPITGQLDPIREIQFLVGAVLHATPLLDVYSYAGIEKESRRDEYSKNGAYGGFGTAAFAPATLGTEGLTGGSTTFASGNFAQVASIQQIIIGAWYSFYKGKYGLMNVGVSDAYTHGVIFGLGAENMNTIMACIRYYPF